MVMPPLDWRLLVFLLLVELEEVGLIQEKTLDSFYEILFD